MPEDTPKYGMVEIEGGFHRVTRYGEQMDRLPTNAEIEFWYRIKKLEDVLRQVLVWTEMTRYDLVGDAVRHIRPVIEEAIGTYPNLEHVPAMMAEAYVRMTESLAANGVVTAEQIVEIAEDVSKEMEEGG